MSNKKTVDNALDILANSQSRRIGPQATQQAMRDVSRANYYQVRINRIRAALLAFVGHAYANQHGHFINVESEYGQLQIVAPWTRGGYKDYGLRKAEGLALQKIMQQVSMLDEPIWWAMFDPDIRLWCVNIKDYPTPAAAHKYLDHVRIDERFVWAWNQVAASRYTPQNKRTT